MYRESGALQTIIPEVATLGEAEWSELLGAIASIPPRRSLLRVAALLAPAGDRLESLMTRLRFSNAEIGGASSIVRAASRPLPSPDHLAAARRWVRDATKERARDALRLQFAEARGRSASGDELAELAKKARVVQGILNRGDPVSVSDLAIDGHALKALGLSPGPELGSALEKCLDAVIDDPELNQRDRLLQYVRDQLTDHERT